MNETSERNRMGTFVGLVVMAFAVTLAMVVGSRLSDKALAVLVGVVFGMGTTILVTLFVVTVGRRRGEQQEYPPVVVVASSRTGPARLSEIPSLTDAEIVVAENGYRRGYRDGWIQATGAMSDLMLEQQLTCQAAYGVCWHHWETTLLPWTWGDCSQVVPSFAAKGQR